MSFELETTTPPKRHPIRRWLLKSILGLVVTCTIFLGLMFLLLYIFKDEAKAYIVAKVNEHVNTVIYIKPENIELSLLQDFPNVTLDFKYVNALDATEIAQRDTLFSADRIGLSFSIFDFFRSKYAIQNIEMEDAQLKLWVDEKGRDNFHFLKDADEKVDTARVNFDLEHIALYNVHVTYTDRSADANYVCSIDKAVCSGAFTTEKYTLKAESDFQLGELRYQGVSYFAGNEGNLKVNLEIDNTTDVYSISEGAITISDVSLNLSGQVRSINQLPQVDMKLSGNAIDLKKALTLLPEQHKKDIYNFDASGNFYVDLMLKGFWMDSLVPTVQGSFGIDRGGSLSRRGSSVQLRNIAVKGSFSNVRGQDKIELSEFSATTPMSSFSGKFLMQGLKRPAYTASLSGKIDLAEMQNLLRIDTIEKVSGKINLQLTTSGRASQGTSLSTSDFRTFNTTGETHFSNVILKIKQSAIPIDSMSGDLKFDGNNMFVQHFRVRSYNSDLQFNGIVRNLLGYLFTSREELQVDASLNAETLDLNALLEDDSRRSKKDTVYHLELPDRIVMQLKARVNYLQFRKFEARAMTGQVQLRDRKMIADPVAFQTMDGQVSGSGMIDGSRLKTLLITGNAHVERVNMFKLFSECENFGQDVITDKHIRGTVTSDFNFASVWGDDLVLDEKKLYARSNLRIDQGQLIDFQPLMALSRFIKLDDLKNIRFNTLQNTIEIKERIIYIPQMDVNSSAIKIKMSGTHDFDNNVDYHFVVGLDELRIRKFKSANPYNAELDVAEQAEAVPTTQLYIRMKGSLDHPDIRYDSKGAIQSLQAGLKNEKQTLKQVLHEEFGWFKKDAATNSPNSSPAKNDKKPDQDGKFIIRFEKGKDEEAPPDDEE